VKKHSSQPSPSLVVALIALVLAAAGTAVAGPAAIERALTKSKVKTIARKQANAQISKRAPAFAHVLADGTVDTANSSRIGTANVTNGATQGYYCFSGLPFPARGGSATVDWNSTGPIDALALLGLGTGTECPAGTQFFVDTRASDGTGSFKTAFFVTVYR
jgi:hypothetical protein